MRKILACFLLLALLCGCGAQMVPTGENRITFYYRRADGSGVERYDSETGALAGKQAALGGDVRAEDVLAQYLLPPENEDFISLFPAGTECLGVRQQKGVLILEMNEAYASLSGYARTLAAAGLTLTLTQLSGVDAVRIKTPSGALLGQSAARLTQADFLLQDTSWLYPERTVRLYFAGTDGSLQAEKRAIAYEAPEDLPESTLRALLDGPESAQLQAAIPAGTRVLDIRVTGTLCTVVLSEEFAACDTGREAAELAVHSVAATLCGLSEIEQVQLQLQSGEDLLYCSIAQPLKPEWSWYN